MAIIRFAVPVVAFTAVAFLLPKLHVFKRGLPRLWARAIARFSGPVRPTARQQRHLNACGVTPDVYTAPYENRLAVYRHMDSARADAQGMTTATPTDRPATGEAPACTAQHGRST